VSVDTPKAERDPLISPTVDDDPKIPPGFHRLGDGNIAPNNRAALRRAFRKVRPVTNGRLSAKRKAPASLATRVAFRRSDGTIGSIPIDAIPEALKALGEQLEASQ
jgi:hypothetical protein